MPYAKQMSAELAEGEDPGPIIAAALAAARDFALGAGLAEEIQSKLLVIVEELVANCVDHGRAGGTLSIDLGLGKPDEEHIELRLSDDGAAFDPTADTGFSGPDADTGGGVGLQLVKSWASEITYEHLDGCNCLRVLVAVHPSHRD